VKYDNTAKSEPGRPLQPYELVGKHELPNGVKLGPGEIVCAETFEELRCGLEEGEEVG